jgi:dUTP pyrophosphatase
VTHAVDVLWTGESAPVYAHPGDAGADLVSTEAFVLEPGERRLVGTGLRIALPDGFAAFVVPRSGLAAKHGITIVNAPGTIDAGYRGEIKVALLNTDRSEPYEVQVGDRIAQLIVMPVPRATFQFVDELPDSVRGAGGFGSSGYGASGAGENAAGADVTVAAVPAPEGAADAGAHGADADGGAAHDDEKGTAR